MSDIDTNIDDILIYLNNELESKGARTGELHFDFDYEQQDLIAYINTTTSKTIENIHETIRICISRDYLEHGYIGGGEFGGLTLTQEGRARALSAKLGKNKNRDTAQHMSIGTIYSYAPFQVGNGNIQNIKNIFECIERLIDESDAPDKDKVEAKSLLTKFLEHPVVCSVIGGIAGGLASRA